MRCCEEFESWCNAVASSPPPLQLLLAIHPQILISSSAPEDGVLTQAGDVCPAAWRRHDALGIPARNVVINLSSG